MWFAHFHCILNTISSQLLILCTILFVTLGDDVDVHRMSAVCLCMCSEVGALHLAPSSESQENVVNISPFSRPTRSLNKIFTAHHQSWLMIWIKCVMLLSFLVLWKRAEVMFSTVIVYGYSDIGIVFLLSPFCSNRMVFYSLTSCLKQWEFTCCFIPDVCVQSGG